MNATHSVVRYDSEALVHEHETYRPRRSSHGLLWEPGSLVEVQGLGCGVSEKTRDSGNGWDHRGKVVMHFRDYIVVL